MTILRMWWINWSSLMLSWETNLGLQGRMWVYTPLISLFVIMWGMCQEVFFPPKNQYNQITCKILVPVLIFENCFSSIKTLTNLYFVLYCQLEFMYICECLHVHITNRHRVWVFQTTALFVVRSQSVTSRCTSCWISTNWWSPGFWTASPIWSSSWRGLKAFPKSRPTWLLINSCPDRSTTRWLGLSDFSSPS